MWRLACLAGVSLLAGLVLGSSACRRTAPPDGTPLYAPFNPRKPVATVAARIDGQRYEVAVRSLMQGRLAIRLETVSLPGDGGAGRVIDASIHECILAGGERARLAAGVLAADLGDAAAYSPATLDVAASALPLDDPGRSMYREWAWIRQPHDLAAIDAELTRLDSLPPCEGERSAG